MQKEKLITKRACLAESVGILKRGQTCTISRLKTCDPWLACFDGGLAGWFEDKLLYFPDSPLGYNQQCFN
jgi:hypothetical protein